VALRERVRSRSGLSWQHTRTSALLGWGSKDAEFLAEHIEALDRARGTALQPMG
jgi:hypothetical protein